MARTKHNRAFKEQAVKLSYSGTVPVSELAADLGIATNMLYRWRRESSDASDVKQAFPGQGRPRDEEIVRLQKALKQAELERDILKKAAVYFATQSK